MKRLEIQGVSFLYNKTSALVAKYAGRSERPLKMPLEQLAKNQKERGFASAGGEHIKIPCKRAGNSLKYQYTLRKWRHSMKNDNIDKKSKIESAVFVRALVLHIVFLIQLGTVVFGTLLALAFALF